MNLAPSTPPLSADPSERHLVQRAVDLLGYVPTAGPSTPTDPNQLLEDMTIPNELARRFERQLRPLGYSLKAQVVRDRFAGAIERQVTAVINGTTAFLLYVPETILSNATPPNLTAVGYLEKMFPADSVLAMLSQGLDVPDLTYKLMFEGWKEARIRARFVPWKHAIQDLRNPAHLMFLLGLPLNPEAAGVRAPTLGDLDEVSKALASLAAPAADPKEFFRDQVRKLHLPAEWEQPLAGVWTGDVAQDSNRLIEALLVRESYPDDHDRKGSWVVGVLIEDLTTQIGPGARRDQLIAILERYGLLPRERIAAIRQGGGQ